MFTTVMKSKPHKGKAGHDFGIYVQPNGMGVGKRKGAHGGLEQ